MLAPELEARVRSELADTLDAPAVIAELLQTTTRGDNLNLLPALHHRAYHLLAAAA